MTTTLIEKLCTASAKHDQDLGKPDALPTHSPNKTDTDELSPTSSNAESADNPTRETPTSQYLKTHGM